MQHWMEQLGRTGSHNVAYVVSGWLARTAADELCLWRPSPPTHRDCPPPMVEVPRAFRDEAELLEEVWRRR